MNFFIKKIIKILLQLTLLLVLFVGIAVYLNYNHKTEYPATIINKYQRLDSLKNTPKIIICGGSSSSYGINSKLLEDTLNMPVVNTSLAMSLGSQFHLNMINDYLHKGDIILYIPEYEYYYGKEAGDDFLNTTLFYYPKIYKDFTKFQKKRFINDVVRLSTEFYFGYFKSKNKPKNSQYSREAYNYLGDNISLVNTYESNVREDTINRYQKLKTTTTSKEFVSFLKNKKAIYDKKGVKLLITYPPLENSQFDKRFLENIAEVKKQTGITFLGNPNQYIYDANFFYDSSYHLNGNGRTLRSQELIKTVLKEFN